jgi:hypothetical protein
MSYTRRDFLKTFTVGGIALFTADWFAAVQAREPVPPTFRLPAHVNDPIPDDHQVINAVWNDGTGYILYLNGTPYGEPPKITLREKLIEECEEGVCEVVDEFNGKYSFYIWDLEELEQEIDADQVEQLNKDGGSYTFEAGETWREFLEREDGDLLADVDSSADEWGYGVLHKLDDNIDWDEHEAWLTDWCRNQSPEADALGYVEGLFDVLELEGEEGVELPAGDESELKGIEYIDGACPGNDTLRCAVAPGYTTLAALQRAIDVLDWKATVVLLEPSDRDKRKGGTEGVR